MKKFTDRQLMKKRILLRKFSAVIVLMAVLTCPILSGCTEDSTDSQTTTEVADNQTDETTKSSSKESTSSSESSKSESTAATDSESKFDAETAGDAASQDAGISNTDSSSSDASGSNSSGSSSGSDSSGNSSSDDSSSGSSSSGSGNSGSDVAMNDSSGNDSSSGSSGSSSSGSGSSSDSSGSNSSDSGSSAGSSSGSSSSGSDTSGSTSPSGTTSFTEAELYSLAQANTATYSAFANEVLRLVNIERANEGLSALVLNTDLCTAANMRAIEMDYGNYFAHIRADQTTSCFSVLSYCGLSYRKAGENIAAGYTTPAEVVNGWMNSEGHRANILSASYTSMGLGYSDSGNGLYGSYWAQLFMG